MPQQLPLFSVDDYATPKVEFPSTRYQGSKRKLVEWIWANIADLDFKSALDLFGGTAAVSHLLKQQCKQVIYNDILHFNWLIGRALIENSAVKLTQEDIEDIISPHDGFEYTHFIQDTFKDIYFTDEENAWLDVVVQNIGCRLNDPFKQAVAWYALFQACIIKRPYNLFHRANLYMRQAAVQRSFGNKTTWDTPFETHFRTFIDEAHRAVFDNGQVNCALNLDVLHAPTDVDLVYIDPPYLNARGVGVDYRDFYHFLEGMVHYPQWVSMIDYQSKHRRLMTQPSAWTDGKKILSAFEMLIQKYQGNQIVLSYRDDGIPTQSEITELLHSYKKQVKVLTLPQKYVLSKQNSHELLFIAK